MKHKQRVSKGFPRLEGKAKVIKIGPDIVQLREEWHSTAPVHEALELVTKLKMTELEDLVKGDIIAFSPYRYMQPYELIYNGKEFEDMGYTTDGDGYLYDDYKVIEEDVPVNYWPNMEYVHFDLEKIKDQCIKNIKANIIILGTTYNWYTTFTYNMLDYVLVYACSSNDNFLTFFEIPEKLKKASLSILEKCDNILFLCP
jgi:hypothetical protein